MVLAASLVTALSAQAQQLPSAQLAGSPPENKAPSSPPDQTNAGDTSSYKAMSLEELMNQEVTSVSKEPEPYGQAPAAIEIITNDQIRRSGASSLPEALRLAPNLDVAQDSASGWNITARGFNAGLSNKLLVLEDGRTVYSPLFSGVIWSAQNVMLEDLDRIEVISGPGGTLWGANAVNGVINIISKSAKDTQGWYMDTGGGTELQYFGDVRYGGKLAPDVYYRIYGTYFERGDEDFAHNNSPATDSWDQGKGGFRIDTDGTSDDQFTLQGDYYNGSSQDTSGLPGVDLESGGNVLGRWTHTFSPDSDMSLQLYYDRTNLSEPKAGFTFLGTLFEPAGILSDNLDTYDLSFQHSFNAGDMNHIVWGLGYRFTHEADGSAPAVQFLPTTLDQNLWSAFVQDEIKLQKDLILTAGTKVEHNDYTGFEVQPSGRLQWNVTPKQMLWTAVSRAVRTPSRIDHDLYEPTGLGVFPPKFNLPGSVLDGTTQFESESLIAYELGYRAQLGDKTTVSVSTYYNQYNHIRSLTPGTNLLGFPIVVQNNLVGETYGAEISATQQIFDWWSLRGGYDLIKEHIHVRTGEVDFTNGTNETADPENEFSLRSSMDLPRNIQFDTGLRWVDDRPMNNGPVVNNIPGYFELDARIAWRPTKDLEISVVGQNLLHGEHAEYGFPNTTQEEIERSVYGKIAWHF